MSVFLNYKKNVLLPVYFLLGFVSISNLIFAQDFSNKGKDFWVGYGAHISMQISNTQDMKLYFTSTVTANVQLFLGNSGTAFATVTVVPGANPPTSVTIPKTGANDARLNAEAVTNRGIHVVSDQPVVCYSHIFDNGASAASLVFPTNTLGRLYTAISYKQISNDVRSVSYCSAIATEDNTLIQVTLPPGVASQTHAAGSSFTQALNKGQVLTLMGATGTPYTNPLINGSGLFIAPDLTGTKFESISSGPNGCKRIAVFSGSSKITIACENFLLNGGNISSDNLYQQMFPQQVWGKRYITVPTLKLPNNIIRVIVSDPTTIVKRNGVTLTGLQNNLYYEYINDPVPPVNSTTPPNPTVDQIDADKPVMVAQYISTRRNCGNYASVAPNNNGDPEMIILSPVEQNINSVSVYSTQFSAIDTSYVNVAIKTAGVSSFKLDGVPVASGFTPVPFNSTYSYAQLKVSQGLHTLKSDSGFNAIAYGYGAAESYGYNAGSNAKDLYQFITLTNPLGNPITKGCKGNPASLSVTLPYPATSITWNFGSNPNISPNATIVNNNPIPTDSMIVDGKKLYVFTLPGTFSFLASGTYTITISANNPTPDGCIGVQVLPFNIEVIDGPTANFSYTIAGGGCASDAVTFTDLSVDTTSALSVWQWDFGDAIGTSALQNPLPYVYGSGGTYNVKLRAFDLNGCFDDTVKVVQFNNTPKTKFGVSGTRCVGSTITVSDSSSITPPATISQWTVNFGDGTIITQTAITHTPTLNHIYTSAGPFTITLTTTSSTGCSGTYQTTINIGALPIASFTLPGNVCLPNTATFTNNSSVVGATYAWNFGDATALVTTPGNPSHQYAGTGPYTVTLTATANGCSKDSVQTLNTIYNKPTANFTVNAENCLKDSTAFLNTSAGNGSTITIWQWFFGDGGTSGLQNPKHLYANPGTYQIKLVVTTDKGCESDTITKQVIVNPLPTANFGYTINCNTKVVTFSDSSLPNPGIVKWHWDFGDGTNTTLLNGNTFTHTFANANVPYTVSLTDTTAKGCSNNPPFQKIITISATPVADFIIPAGNFCLPSATPTFTNNSTLNGAVSPTMTYIWNFGDGTGNLQSPPLPLNPVHTYTVAGPFTVKLTAITANGCTDSATKIFNSIFAPPVAAFAIPQQVCLGDSMSFTNQSTPLATVDQWQWDFGDGSTSLIANPKHLYLTADTFTVTLIVKSGSICTSLPVTQKVIVNPLPVAAFAVLNTSRCQGNKINFSDNSLTPAGSNITEWHWDFGDGTSDIVKNPVHSYTNAGTYNVTLWVKNSKGCSSATTSLPVTIHALPVVNFTPVFFCNRPDSVIFTSNSTVPLGFDTSWTWSFGDGTIGTGTPVKHIYSTFGVSTVGLTVISNNGCIDSLKKQITIVNNPVAKDSVININHLCSNQPVSVVNLSNATGAGSFTKIDVYWDYLNNTAINSTDNAPLVNNTYTHLYPEFGAPDTLKKTIAFITYNTNNCSDTILHVINLLASPKIQFLPLLPVCEEVAPFDLTGAVDIYNLGGNGVLYSGNGISSSPTFSPALAGSGTSIIKYSDTAANGCFTDTTQSILVNPTPAVTYPATFTTEPGYNLTLQSINTPIGNLTYLWTELPNSNYPLANYLDNEFSPAPTLLNPTHDVNYLVKIVSNPDGCTDSGFVKVLILDDFVVPNTFTPNGDGINDAWIINNLSKYPDHRVQVFNRYGQILFDTKKFTKWDGLQKGKPLPFGTYYYIIELGGVRNAKTGYVTIIK